MFLGYGRVSTAEQAASDATSLNEQEKKCYAMAQLRGAGAYDFSMYLDPGVSGSVKFSERPDGQRLLFDMKQGDCIIATKLDRMFRSASDALVTVENLRSRQVDLILIDLSSEPITTHSVAKMTFGLMASFAEFERERINERTEDGRRAKRAIGGHMGGPPPFGYQVVGRGRQAKLEANPIEQPTLEAIKKLMWEHTPASACREAARMGLRNRNGGPFQICHLQRIAAREQHVG